MTEAKNKTYRALTGIDYPPLKRAEPGDLVTDLDPKSIPDLLAVGAIEPAKETTS